MIVDVIFSGLPRLAIGVFMLLLLYGAIPVKNTGSLISRKPNLMKIIAFVLVVSGSYTLVSGFMNSADNQEFEWTETDKKSMIKQCFDGSGTLRDQYPKLTHEYCSCAVTEITTKLKKKDYLKVQKQGKDAQLKYEYNVAKYCYFRYVKAMERAKQGKQM
jgi:hypothetical protein